MKHLLLAAALAIPAVPARAQEDELTPQQALELLEEAKALMDKAEAELNRSSESRDPGQGALERIEKLIRGAETKERGAADKLGELIRKAREAGGTPRDSRRPDDRGDRSSKPPDKSKEPPKHPYDPKRDEPPSKFQSSAQKSGAWGNLPPDIRRAMLSASKEEVPPEFQELWSTYFKNLEKAAAR